MIRIVLLGGGGHASDVLGVVEDLQDAGGFTAPIEVVGFLDDGDVDLGRFAGREVTKLGTIDDLASVDATHYVLAVGWPSTRHAIAARVAQARTDLVPATLVHPTATVGRGATVGEGTVVMAGVHLSPMVQVGRHACLSNHAVVGHDCIIGDFAGLMPGAVLSGNTQVGEGCLVGTNATLIEGLTLGAWSKLGAGAVAIADVEPSSVVVGVPARAVTPNAEP